MNCPYCDKEVELERGRYSDHRLCRGSGRLATESVLPVGAFGVLAEKAMVDTHTIKPTGTNGRWYAFGTLRGAAKKTDVFMFSSLYHCSHTASAPSGAVFAPFVYQAKRGPIAGHVLCLNCASGYEREVAYQKAWSSVRKEFTRGVRVSVSGHTHHWYYVARSQCPETDTPSGKHIANIEARMIELVISGVAPRPALTRAFFNEFNATAEFVEMAVPEHVRTEDGIVICDARGQVLVRWTKTELLRDETLAEAMRAVQIVNLHGPDALRSFARAG